MPILVRSVAAADRHSAGGVAESSGLTHKMRQGSGWELTDIGF